MTDVKRENKPMPEGVSISIPEIWNRSVLLGASGCNSLTDPSEDMPEITLSFAKVDTLEGMLGQNKINFLIAADLEKLNGVANIAVGVAWDPVRHRTAPLIFQSNLKSEAHVEQAFRCDILPKYPYLYAPGVHELVVMAQLREVSTTWQYDDGDYTSFTEFPSIGETVMRKIKVVITE